MRFIIQMVLVFVFCVACFPGVFSKAVASEGEDLPTDSGSIQKLLPSLDDIDKSCNTPSFNRCFRACFNTLPVFKCQQHCLKCCC